MSMADHYLLFYEYVEKMASRRAPYREEHLARVRAGRRAGHIVMAGALGEDPRGAALVFRGVEPAAIEDFVRGDPYVQAGLVRSWRIDRWNLV